MESTPDTEYLDDELLSCTDESDLSESLGSIDDESVAQALADLHDPSPKRKKQDLSWVRFTTTHFFKVSPVWNQHAVEVFEQLFVPTVRDLFMDGKITFFVGGLELCPETKRYHVQGYMELPPRAKRRIGPAAKLITIPAFQPPHVEPAKKSAQQNIVYCLKSCVDGASCQYGTPRDDRTIGQRNKALWAETRRKAEAGDFAGIHDQHYVSFFGNVQKIHFSAPRALKDLEKLDNTWIVGPPGVGKSRGARLIAALKSRDLDGKPYFKPANNKWWDSYNQEKVVILDDMELDAKYMAHELKLVSDRYVCRVEIKGASTMIRPDMVIVTSNYTPDEIWATDAICAAAVKRRFRLVRINEWVPFEKACHDGSLFSVSMDHNVTYGLGPDQYVEFNV